MEGGGYLNSTTHKKTDNRKTLQSFEVPSDMDGLRIDRFLAEIYPEKSRSFFQKLVRGGNVRLNGETVKKNSAEVETEDLVEVEIPEVESVDIQPENIPLDILYEDEDLLVVNKPKDMVVHPAPGHYSGTLVNAVMYHCGSQLSGINGVIRPGIVHRIDKDTTGSLIVCKNDHSHQLIAAQIKEHSVTRRYVGIVYGRLKEPEGVIDAPIGRHPVERKKMTVNMRNGRRAVTHYRVLETFRDYSYVQFELETGRTHQIRVHMAYIHHPLLGDEVYGPSKSKIRNLQGQTLHAKTIGFIHPSTGKYMEVSAPLPDYFQELLEKLRKH